MKKKDIEQKALALPRRAEKMEVADPESFRRAGDLFRQIKAMEREVMDAFGSSLERSRAAYKEQKELRDRFTRPLKEAAEKLAREIGEWSDRAGPGKAESEDLVLRDIWKYEITDAALIPEPWTVRVPNRKALLEAAYFTKGGAQIPGVRFYKVKGLAIRKRAARE